MGVSSYLSSSSSNDARTYCVGVKMCINLWALLKYLVVRAYWCLVLV